MSLAEAKGIAGSLGIPSKMPGWSYGLDAKRCKVGRELAQVPGSTCFNCFALKNFYATWKPALIARERREAGISHPRWVDAMVTLISHYCVPPNDYFRWHDSGDLRSLSHLANIAEVCRRTPMVKHWLPTKEYEIVQAYLAAGLEVPENLCIRLSAYYIDTEPVLPVALVGMPTATVSTPGVQSVVEGKGSITCMAIAKRDNMCGPCRACWNPRVTNVSYPEH